MHNFVSLGFSNILCEAAAVARLHNIDADKLVQVLDTGGGKGTILERLKPMIQHSDDSNFIFSLKNCAKDIDYYQQFSENQLAMGSIAPQISAIFHQAVRETSPHTTIPNLIPIQAQTNNNDE